MASVFLSYTSDDWALAERISDMLARAGIHTTNETWELSSRRRDWAAVIEQDMKASDVVVVLIPAEIASSEADTAELEVALSRDLDRRGVELIPIIATPMPEAPSTVRQRGWVDLATDLEAGVRALAEQILAISRADFSTMSDYGFLNLVADLLQALGFRLEAVAQRDRGVDLRGTYQRTDPFGAPETEVWLVETKLYAHQRVSVARMQQLAEFLAREPRETRGLFVTNAQLTSIAQEFLTELRRRPEVRLQILDGPQLKRLLRQFPDVTARHFGGEAGRGGAHV
ncbi:TIR domain-containing protein [Amycolatopsis sp. NPDC059021]|uniref:TIR domain-containing protein n=1 Tax=Amycolatopsis sp. NPDC059021 TaxID=3346704 RepID=UPI00366C0BBA